MSSATATVPAALQKRRDIKAGNDPTDLRRRRADSALSIRKQKKEQGLAKRRNTASMSASAALAGGAAGSGSADPSTSESAAGNSQRPLTAADVPRLTRALTETDGAARVEAARDLRKVLSLESDPPVVEVIQGGAMPSLVQFLDDHTNTELQVRARTGISYPNIIRRLRSS